MNPPAAIIFINDGVTLDYLNTLKTHTGIQPNRMAPWTPSSSTVMGIDTQLEITETMWFEEFNARVEADPTYPAAIHLNGLRILVILPDFQCHLNRELADIVLFSKQGVTSVLRSKFGPPGLTFDNQRLNIWNLTNAIKGNNTACYPFPGFLPFPQTQTKENPRPHEHLRRHRPQGMGDLELFGVEAMESQHGRQDGAFGGEIDEDEDGSSGTSGED
jgi:hypothetical protein